MAHIAKKILIVNKDFQFRYTFNVVLIGVLTTILSISIILIPLYIFGILRIPRFLPTPILLTMLAAVIINIVVVVLLTIASTHRIAGPVYALNRALRYIELGKWNFPLKLRNTDEMKYLATNFNVMVDSLVNTTKQDIKEIDSLIDILEDFSKLDGFSELDNNARSGGVLEAISKLYSFKQKLNQRIDKNDVIGTAI